MFFWVPFGIFVISLIAIGWIISRKFIYLKKLNPEAIEDSAEIQGGFWEDFFPGLSAFLKNINLREYRLNFLAEFEKFLRKLRLISLKIDTTTNRLIHRVRKSVVHHEGLINGEAAAQVEREIINAEVHGSGERDLKEMEQQLIIEIAKNPKDSQLYKKLGNIYMKTGEWHDAVESFKKALELEPGDDAIRAKLEKLEKRLAKNMLR